MTQILSKTAGSLLIIRQINSKAAFLTFALSLSNVNNVKEFSSLKLVCEIN